MPGTVNWYKETVLLEVKDSNRDLLATVAAFIEGQAKINIVANDQVDTGFMLNSVYWRIGSRTTYSSTWSSGVYEGSRSAGERRIAPQAELGEAEGYVAVGAEYAIFQELLQPFLYPAVQAAAAQFNSVAKVEPF